MMAKAIATECEASFHAVGISDVLNMWIGESERQLAAIFEKARADTPSVLFFDELDALAYARSKASHEHTRTLVNEFLAQLDGLGRDNDKLLVLAATNMPWDVDAAMKRPGRFDRQIFVPPPDEEARAEMLKIKLTGASDRGNRLWAPGQDDPALLGGRHRRPDRAGEGSGLGSHSRGWARTPLAAIGSPARRERVGPFDD